MKSAPVKEPAWNEPPCSKPQGIQCQKSPPLMGGDKGEGGQPFCQPHFTLLNKDGEEFVTYPFIYSMSIYFPYDSFYYPI